MAADSVAPIAVIVGETASGKSSVALRLAEEFGGEIVAADSWTVRRGVDIGTAKPTASERAAVPHHMIDVVDACQNFTAAVYKQQATDVIDDIHRRGKLPMLVGGTGLYIDAVLYDYSFLPPGDPAERARYNDMTIEQLLQIAKQRNLDTTSVDTRNKRRIIRLIESRGVRPNRSDIRPNTLVLGLRVDSDVLKTRVASRVEHMISAGLEQEVRSLAERYGWNCEALKGIGYVEWQPYFAGELDSDEVVANIVRNTLALAKRQRTWFRRNDCIQWCGDYQQCYDKLYAFIENQTH